MHIKAKKHLGQHFLADLNIAKKIVQEFSSELTGETALEIGPGKGVLTKILLEEGIPLSVAEVDKECVDYLSQEYPQLNIHFEDFLKMDLDKVSKEEISIIGNFPYNISSQILFKIIANKEKIPTMVGMFQKEVAERVMASHGNKTYGILSVITQCFYDVEYLFTVNESVFIPPPNVKSAVIKLKRKEKNLLPNNISASFFQQIIKAAFNQRRKTLKNSLRNYYNEKTAENTFWTMRPEQLSVEELAKMASLLHPIVDNNTHQK